MRHRPYNLAIETSDHLGWLTLGREDEILESTLIGSDAVKAATTIRPRRGSDLMPTLEALCQRHDISPGDLGEIYVSMGPGSFTGLRVAMAAVKMLARFLEVRLVAVPTIEVVASQVPAEEPLPATLAIALNFKQLTAYAGLYKREMDQDPSIWIAQGQACVMSMDELLDQPEHPLALMAPALPADYPLPAHVTRLESDLGQPHSDSVWHLGRIAARQGLYTDVRHLLPIYARPPEAVTLWNQRHGSE